MGKQLTLSTMFAKESKVQAAVRMKTPNGQKPKGATKPPVGGGKAVSQPDGDSAAACSLDGEIPKQWKPTDSRKVHSETKEKTKDSEVEIPNSIPNPTSPPTSTFGISDKLSPTPKSPPSPKSQPPYPTTTPPLPIAQARPYSLPGTQSTTPFQPPNKSPPLSPTAVTPMTLATSKQSLQSIPKLQQQFPSLHHAPINTLPATPHSRHASTTSTSIGASPPDDDEQPDTKTRPTPHTLHFNLAVGPAPKRAKATPFLPLDAFTPLFDQAEQHCLQQVPTPGGKRQRSCGQHRCSKCDRITTSGKPLSCMQSACSDTYDRSLAPGEDPLHLSDAWDCRTLSRPAPTPQSYSRIIPTSDSAPSSSSFSSSSSPSSSSQPPLPVVTTAAVAEDNMVDTANKIQEWEEASLVCHGSLSSPVHGGAEAKARSRRTTTTSHSLSSASHLAVKPSGECDLCDVVGGNIMLRCTACHLSIHKECYVVDGNLSSLQNWKCRWCAAGEAKMATCIICRRMDSHAKIRAAEGGWCHSLCYITISECFVVTLDSGELVVNGLPDALRNRAGLQCDICSSRDGGACLQCSKGACTRAAHPMCAFVSSKSGQKKWQHSNELFTFYCPEHAGSTHVPGGGKGEDNGRRRVKSECEDGTEQVKVKEISKAFTCVDQTNGLPSAASRGLRLHQQKAKKSRTMAVPEELAHILGQGWTVEQGPYWRSTGLRHFAFRSPPPLLRTYNSLRAAIRFARPGDEEGGRISLEHEQAISTLIHAQFGTGREPKCAPPVINVEAEDRQSVAGHKHETSGVKGTETTAEENIEILLAIANNHEEDESRLDLGKVLHKFWDSLIFTGALHDQSYKRLMESKALKADWDRRTGIVEGITHHVQKGSLDTLTLAQLNRHLREEGLDACRDKAKAVAAVKHNLVTLSLDDMVEALLSYMEGRVAVPSVYSKSHFFSDGSSIGRFWRRCLDDNLCEDEPAARLLTNEVLLADWNKVHRPTRYSEDDVVSPMVALNGRGSSGLKENMRIPRSKKRRDEGSYQNAADKEFYMDPVTLDWLSEPVFIVCRCFGRSNRCSRGRYLGRQTLEAIVINSEAVTLDEGTGQAFSLNLACPTCRAPVNTRTLKQRFPDIEVDPHAGRVDLSAAVDHDFEEQVELMRGSSELAEDCDAVGNWDGSMLESKCEVNIAMGNSLRVGHSTSLRVTYDNNSGDHADDHGSDGGSSKGSSKGDSKNEEGNEVGSKGSNAIDRGTSDSRELKKPRGVSWNKRSRKWYTYVLRNGKKIHLGTFSTLEAAIERRHQYDRECDNVQSDRLDIPGPEPPDLEAKIDEFDTIGRGNEVMDEDDDGAAEGNKKHENERAKDCASTGTSTPQSRSSPRQDRPGVYYNVVNRRWNALKSDEYEEGGLIGSYPTEEEAIGARLEWENSEIKAQLNEDKDSDVSSSAVHVPLAKSSTHPVARLEENELERKVQSNGDNDTVMGASPVHAPFPESDCQPVATPLLSSGVPTTTHRQAWKEKQRRDVLSRARESQPSSYTTGSISKPVVILPPTQITHTPNTSHRQYLKQLRRSRNPENKLQPNSSAQREDEVSTMDRNAGAKRMTVGTTTTPKCRRLANLLAIDMVQGTTAAPGGTRGDRRSRLGGSAIARYPTTAALCSKNGIMMGMDTGNFASTILKENNLDETGADDFSKDSEMDPSTFMCDDTTSTADARIPRLSWSHEEDNTLRDFAAQSSAWDARGRFRNSAASDIMKAQGYKRTAPAIGQRIATLRKRDSRICPPVGGLRVQEADSNTGHESRGAKNAAASTGERKRRPYKCSKCGQQKNGHSCPYGTYARSFGSLAKDTNNNNDVPVEGMKLLLCVCGKAFDNCEDGLHLYREHSQTCTGANDEPDLGDTDLEVWGLTVEELPSFTKEEDGALMSLVEAECYWRWSFITGEPGLARMLTRHSYWAIRRRWKFLKSSQPAIIHDGAYLGPCQPPESLLPLNGNHPTASSREKSSSDVIPPLSKKARVHHSVASDQPRLTHPGSLPIHRGALVRVDFPIEDNGGGVAIGVVREVVRSPLDTVDVWEGTCDMWESTGKQNAIGVFDVNIEYTGKWHNFKQEFQAEMSRSAAVTYHHWVDVPSGYSISVLPQKRLSPKQKQNVRYLMRSKSWQLESAQAAHRAYGQTEYSV